MTVRPEAAYARLSRELREDILRGRYSGDTRLPTEAELAAQYQVSRQTVRRAFHDLVAEGLVQRIPGRGTYATKRSGEYLRQFGSVEDLLALSEDTELVVLDPLRRLVDVEAAGRLRLGTDVVYRTSFRRVHQDVSFCLTTVWLPPDIGARLIDLPQLRASGAVSDATVIGLIDKHAERPIAEAEQSITAVAATEVVAGRLGCAPGDPLLRVDRTYLDTDGDPVELAVSYFRPEHYSYRVRLRRSST